MVTSPQPLITLDRIAISLVPNNGDSFYFKVKINQIHVKINWTNLNNDQAT